MVGVDLRVRLCVLHFCISGTDGRIVLKLGVWLGLKLLCILYSHKWGISGTCLPLFYLSVTVVRIVLDLMCYQRHINYAFYKDQGDVRTFARVTAHSHQDIASARSSPEG